MSILAAIVLALFFLLLLSRGDGIREGLVKAALLFGASVVGVTELLSYFDAFTRTAVAALWALVAVALAWHLVRKSDRPRIGDAAVRLKSVWDGASPLARFAAGAAAFLLAGTLTVALAAPPNTWDAMTYHMARVSAWIQHANVAFYPTSIIRQNYQTPLAGYGVAHLQILSGSDHWANLVQWSAFLLCGALASLAAREFGLPPTGQALAGLAALTLPTAVLQGSSAQNDLVCAACCLAFAWFLLRFRVTGARPDGLFAGLALGLALLAKGTAYIFCAGIGSALGAAVLFARPAGERRSLAVTAAVAAAIVTALNAGHWARSAALYGTPVSSGTDRLANETLAPAAMASVTIRNAAMHLGLPNDAWNAAVTRGVKTLLGAEASNPATTWFGMPFRVGWSRHEDLAGNVLHTLLIAAGFLSLLFAARDKKARPAQWLAAAALLAFVLFSAAIKWQPWHMRLEIPVFMLAIPAGMAGLHRWRLTQGAAGVLLAGALVAGSLPFLLDNQTRSLLSSRGSVLTTDRAAQYFANQPGLRAAYAAAARWILDSGANEVGLMLGADDWEYPLWVFTGKHGTRRAPEFRHVWVSDASAVLAPRREPPELVFTTLPLAPEAISRNGYEVAFQSGPIRILRRVNPRRTT
jgi:hypothetical protein